MQQLTVNNTQKNSENKQQMVIKKNKQFYKIYRTVDRQAIHTVMYKKKSIQCMITRTTRMMFHTTNRLCLPSSSKRRR